MQLLPALFHDPRRQRALAVLGCCVVLLGAAPWAAAQTVDQAKAYFKDFDDHTLRRTGEFVNKIYGVTDPTDQAQLDAAADKVAKDIFDGFASAAGRAVQLEALQAHGKPVEQKDLDALEKAYKDLKDSGAMERLSKLQLSILEKHFPKAGGGIDLAKADNAIVMFANGELRAGNANGDGEMNQLHQWYIWKAFAAQAIQRNVDKAQWEPLLKSLQQGIEIYRQVYPGRDPAVVEQNKIITSDLTRFDGTQQLNAAAKTALANAINPLTTAQVLTREAGTLKDDMSLLALALPPLNLDIQLAGLTRRADGSYLASFAALLTDPLSGQPMDGGALNFTARDSSITTDATSYVATGAFTPETTGRYRTTLVLPGSVRDVVLEGFGVEVQAWDIVAAPVPEPAAWLLWLGGGLLLARWAAKRSAHR